MKNIPTNEIRKKAIEFSKTWKNETYEKGETHSFYDDFFRVFGNERYGIAQYEKRVGRFGKEGGFIDLFYPGVLLVEQKSAGRNLKDAKDQADKYFNYLKEDEKPRYILTCDFQNFHLYDSKINKSYQFKLSELSENIKLFEFLQNVEEIVEQYYIGVNTKVTESIGHIYRSLRSKNYGSPHIEKFLTRITFCLFAEDMEIFKSQSMFQKFIQDNTDEHGGNLGEKLHRLFEVLNTDQSKRQIGLDEEYAQFPYINGDLFKDNINTPQCDKMIRDRILDACKHEWIDISPAIFGSMFQSIMDKDERRSSGAHYTEEVNILKIIQPLFLDDLKNEFTRIKKGKNKFRNRELEKLQNKLAELTFFDPACGAGNFLIIAYREIRRLEMEIISELRKDKVIVGDASGLLSKINVSQFYGIEINNFSVQIARTALWMMDHKMNMELSDKFGELYVRIPLGKSPNIINDDALEIDWNKVLDSNKCSYVFGNPPFYGKREQTAKQSKQLSEIVKLGKTGGGMLDYVTAWFLKAGQYIVKETKIGFVATNSITQGIQVNQLQNALFDRYKLDIIFAYKSFKWTSKTKHKAQVIVVIIGMAKKFNGKKVIYYNDGKSSSVVKHITPRLSASTISIKRAKIPINGFPKTRKGNAITDGNNYVFTEEEKEVFCNMEPKSRPYFREYLNAHDLLHNQKHWVLFVHLIPTNLLKTMPETKKRIELVRKFRSNSRKENTRKLASMPKKFERLVDPVKKYLVIPVVSSEKREYFIVMFLEPPCIASAANIVCEEPSIELFSFLSSTMHMVWLKHFAGRLKSDIRYSNLAYNTFPVPKGNFNNIKSCGKKILDIRKKNINSEMADLYNPTIMPNDLKKAHQDLDREIEKLYRKEQFNSNQERLEFLLQKYKEMIAEN